MSSLDGVIELESVCRGCETDAGRRPAARPFVQDAHIAVRLRESRSRRHLRQAVLLPGKCTPDSALTG